MVRAPVRPCVDCSGVRACRPCLRRSVQGLISFKKEWEMRGTSGCGTFFGKGGSASDGGEAECRPLRSERSAQRGRGGGRTRSPLPCIGRPSAGGAAGVRQDPGVRGRSGRPGTGRCFPHRDEPSAPPAARRRKRAAPGPSSWKAVDQRPERRRSRATRHGARPPVLRRRCRTKNAPVEVEPSGRGRVRANPATAPPWRIRNTSLPGPWRNRDGRG